jgi:hypothetical protein
MIWLMKMIGHGVVIDLGDAAFLRAHDAGEIAPVIDHQRHVGMRGFPDRLAVVERLDQRQQFQIGFDLVGDLVQDAGAFLHGGAAPGVLCLVSGIKRQFYIRGRRARNLTELLAGDRAGIIEILAFLGRDPFSADEIVIAVTDQNLLGNLIYSLLVHAFLPDATAPFGVRL